MSVATEKKDLEKERDRELKSLCEAKRTDDSWRSSAKGRCEKKRRL